MKWKKVFGLETRDASYTDALVNLIQAQSGGVSPDSSALGALEVAAGLWSRGFASAVLTPTSSITEAVTASVLASIGRSLVRKGESLHVLEVGGGGRLRLVEAGSWDISGGFSPESWVYNVELPGPSDSVSRSYPSESVVHCRFAWNSSTPWKGISPLEFARSTGSLASFLETRLSEEASAPVGHVLPVPSDGGDGSADDPLASLKRDLANLGGGISLVETTSGAWGEGRGSAPRSDWHPQRLGADFPESSVLLWEAVGRLVLSVCGCPPSLASGTATGPAQLVGWRRFLHGTLQPVSKLILSELREKLEVPDLELEFR